MSRPADARRVDAALLEELRLPDHEDGASKHDRGSVLVIGGSDETPGAVLLAGIAALRVGAGRLQLATVAGCGPALGVAVPEALVVSLPSTPEGAIDPSAAGALVARASRAQAVLVGPGMLDTDAAEPIVDALTDAMTEGVLVVDAGALPAVGRHPEWTKRLDGRVLLVPNPSELECLEIDADDLRRGACEAATRFGAVVACRGPETWIATPDGTLFLDEHGTVGLATSGSGDVAGGLAAGLVARGADPVCAAIWAAALHGRAGERLSARVAPVGFLARELLDEVPATMRELQG